jgi:hypothetical protein
VRALPLPTTDDHAIAALIAAADARRAARSEKLAELRVRIAPPSRRQHRRHHPQRPGPAATALAARPTRLRVDDEIAG